MGQLSSCGLGSRSGSAVAVRQGALRLRDLHEDTTGPGQGEGGVRGKGISLQHTELIVNSTGEHYLSNNSQLTSWCGHVTVW